MFYVITKKIIADGVLVGEVTSGSFSPTLNKGIALARVNADIGKTCLVDIGGKQVTAQVTKPPFVKKNIVVTVGV